MIRVRRRAILEPRARSCDHVSPCGVPSSSDGAAGVRWRVDSSISIRRATTDDAGTIAAIQVGTWRVAYRGLVPDAHLEKMSVERSAKRHREALATGGLEVYLAEQNGEAAGFVGLGACRDEDLDATTTGEVWGIYLHPSAWRKGIGTQLCRYAEDVLRGRGFTSLVIWVFAGNANARRFYEAMGYSAECVTQPSSLGVLPPDVPGLQARSRASKILDLGRPLEAIRYRRDFVARADA
jgi:GNAT superfamily N-acetyltransferase